MINIVYRLQTIDCIVGKYGQACQVCLFTSHLTADGGEGFLAQVFTSRVIVRML